MRGWYFFILLVIIKNTSGINVGVGISDITGPAAEVGMVSEIKKGCKIIVFKLWYHFRWGMQNKARIPRVFIFGNMQELTSLKIPKDTEMSLYLWMPL